MLRGQEAKRSPRTIAMHVQNLQRTNHAAFSVPGTTPEAPPAPATVASAAGIPGTAGLPLLVSASQDGPPSQLALFQQANPPQAVPDSPDGDGESKEWK